MKARIKFRKYGVMRFIGHLDVMRFFQKAMRRAGIPIAFTGGYSPHMIMSFAQPLGVGVTSDGEYLDIELKEPIASAEAVRRLNNVTVEGIDIVSFREISEDKKDSGMTIVQAAGYKAFLLESAKSSDVHREIPESWKEKLDAFMAQEQIVVLKRTKRSEKQVDIKPMIYQMEMGEDGIYLFLAAGSEQNLKPDLVIAAFLEYMNENTDNVPFCYHRLDVYAKAPEKTLISGQSVLNGSRSFVPLEELGQDIFKSAERTL